MSWSLRVAKLGVAKCDARRCGSPAEVFTRFGARYCRGHGYLAEVSEPVSGEGHADVHSRQAPKYAGENGTPGSLTSVGVPPVVTG